MARKIIISKYQSKEALTARDDLDLGFLELLGEGVMVLNRARLIVGTNTAFERLLGWTQAELVGRPCAFFFGCQEGPWYMIHSFPAEWLCGDCNAALLLKRQEKC